MTHRSSPAQFGEDRVIAFLELTMNALLYAVGRIKYQIPAELLHYGLTYGEDTQLFHMSSMDEKIMMKIMRPIVLIDANIVGGVEHTIALDGISPAFTEPFYTVYAVPPDKVMGKEILSVQSVCYLPSTGFTGMDAQFGLAGGLYTHSLTNASSGMSVMNVASRIGNAASGTGMNFNAAVELVARNTVAIHAHIRTLASYALRLTLENDTNLNNIQPKSYGALGDLAVLAAKQYIYNKLIVPVNSGYLSGGQELGIFKSVLESYSEAYEQYRIFLETKWKPVAYMNDVKWHHDFIGSMIAPDL